MKLSSVVRYIQKTKECRNSFLGILICHEIMFHVMSYSVCHFLLTATELQVTYQLDGASLFFVLPRSRCPPCPTASSRGPQSSGRWIPRRTPSCYSRRPISTPPGTPASLRSRRPGRPWGVLPRGDLGGALLALPVLLGQVHALQTLLLLRLLLPLLLVVTLKPLTTLADALQPQSSAVASVLALALLDRSSTISC